MTEHAFETVPVGDFATREPNGDPAAEHMLNVVRELLNRQKEMLDRLDQQERRIRDLEEGPPRDM